MLVHFFQTQFVKVAEAAAKALPSFARKVAFGVTQGFGQSKMVFESDLSGHRKESAFVPVCSFNRAAGQPVPPPAVYRRDVLSLELWHVFFDVESDAGL